MVEGQACSHQKSIIALFLMRKHTQPPRVSVVIPVKNGRATLGPCLEGVLAQTMRRELEIIVIDSGSKDGTLALLGNYPVRVEQISPERFNHGATRNLGAKLAQGEFVAMTVQDARPVDEYWLERMVRHFEDPKVAGVCGQQVVPHEPDKSPLQWFRPYSEPRVKKVWFAKPAEFDRLSAAKRVSLCGWDDVTAMYRRSTLLEVPFRRVSFAEDVIWASDALCRGQALVYDYSARVYHYHHENFSFRFRREFTILFHRYGHFGHLPLPAWLLPELARCLHRIVRRKYCPDRRLHWLGYGMRLVAADWLSGWCFWIACRLGGARVVGRLHRRWCEVPPQAVQTT